MFWTRKNGLMISLAQTKGRSEGFSRIRIVPGFAIAFHVSKIGEIALKFLVFALFTPCAGDGNTNRNFKVSGTPCPSL